jgi:N-formylglutamate deformylase
VPDEAVLDEVVPDGSAPEEVAVSIVLHVPHASTHVPDDVRRGLVLDDAALTRELLASTDHHTDTFVAGLDRADAFPGVAAGRVRLHVNRHSRLVVDPERFLDPEREATEAVGRGAVYTHGHDGLRLRDPDAPGWTVMRADLIAHHFEPYHASIEQLVAGMLETHGECTIVDVHSYPRDAQPYELAGGLDPASLRPELCIGTDPVHTPGELRDTVAAVAGALGVEIALDTPFSGTFVPTRWLGDTRVRSVMLEVRRDTYMDEATGALHAGAGRARTLVRDVVAALLADQDA